MSHRLPALISAESRLLLGPQNDRARTFGHALRVVAPKIGGGNGSQTFRARRFTTASKAGSTVSGPPNVSIASRSFSSLNRSQRGLRPSCKLSSASPILSQALSIRYEHTASHPTKPTIYQEPTPSNPVIETKSTTNPTETDSTAIAHRPAKRVSLFNRFLPSSFAPEEGSTSSVKKLMELARPEKKQLTYAIGLVSGSSPLLSPEKNY